MDQFDHLPIDLDVLEKIKSNPVEIVAGAKTSPPENTNIVPEEIPEPEKKLPAVSALPIFLYPHDILWMKSSPIEKISEELKHFIKCMTMTMYLHKGVGLSAIQVGMPLKLFIVDAQINGGSKAEPPIVFINPEIIDSNETLIISKEGCLSFPGVVVQVSAPKTLTIKATDLNGSEFTLNTKDYFARCIAHEMEHLDGKTLMSKIKSRLKKEQVKRKMKRVRKYANKERFI